MNTAVLSLNGQSRIVFNILVQHLLEHSHRVGQTVLLCCHTVKFSHIFPLIRMIKPVVDGPGEILGAAGLEQASAVEGELRRGADLRIGDDRHQPGGKGFDAGDGLALHIAGMYVQVALQQQVNQFLLLEIDKLGRIFNCFPSST